MTENRILFTGGLVFDGTGSPAVPADVVVRGDRIESVRPGGGTQAEPGDQVVDCAGATVMPGLVESHAHLTFPSAVGHIDPSFNPPLDVSFFRHMPTPDEHLEIAKRNAKILLEEHKESVFLSPAVGIMWANVYEGAEYGIDAAMATTMGSVKALRAMTELYPELRKRGLRVLPGGDYGFPNNPIGRNARDLELFVRLFGYSPAEALRATTQYGGQVMDLPVGLLTPGYLAGIVSRSIGFLRAQASLG